MSAWSGPIHSSANGLFKGNGFQQLVRAESRLRPPGTAPWQMLYLHASRARCLKPAGIHQTHPAVPTSADNAALGFLGNRRIGTGSDSWVKVG
jgi:hypothetical protein